MPKGPLADVSLRDRMVVEPGSKVRLAGHDPGATNGWRLDPKYPTRDDLQPDVVVT